MAITREKKEQQVSELKDLLTQSTAVVICDYRGLTAVQMANLRNKLRPFKARVMVAKNTLVLRTLAELGMPQPEEMLQGPSSFSILYGDLAAPIRALLEFRRDNEALVVKGGILGSQIMDPARVQLLVTLPGIEVLRAEALGGLQAPMAGLLGIFDGALQGLVGVLHARTEQMEKASA